MAIYPLVRRTGGPRYLSPIHAQHRRCRTLVHGSPWLRNRSSINSRRNRGDHLPPNAHVAVRHSGLWVGNPHPSSPLSLLFCRGHLLHKVTTSAGRKRHGPSRFSHLSPNPLHSAEHRHLFARVLPVHPADVHFKLRLVPRFLGKLCLPSNSHNERRLGGRTSFAGLLFGRYWSAQHLHLFSGILSRGLSRRLVARRTHPGRHYCVFSHVWVWQRQQHSHCACLHRSDVQDSRVRTILCDHVHGGVVRMPARHPHCREHRAGQRRRLPKLDHLYWSSVCRVGCILAMVKNVAAGLVPMEGRVLMRVEFRLRWNGGDSECK